MQPVCVQLRHKHGVGNNAFKVEQVFLRDDDGNRPAGKRGSDVNLMNQEFVNLQATERRFDGLARVAGR